MKNEEKTCLYCGEKPVSIEMRCTHPTQGASHGVSLKTCVGCFNKRPVEKQLTCPMCEKVAAIFVDVVQAYHGDRFKAMLWATWSSFRLKQDSTSRSCSTTCRVRIIWTMTM